jgi:hypothetical protein
MRLPGILSYRSGRSKPLELKAQLRGFLVGQPVYDLPREIVEPIQQISLTGKSPRILSIPFRKNILIYRISKEGLYS